MDRKEFVKEKDNIQTSLKSKVIDEAQEKFKFAQRRQGLIDAKRQNFENTNMQTQNNFANRNLQLQDE